jgi:hypothetical protein
MNTQHETAPHGFVSLREYVDIRFAAAKEAVEKVERATELRFASVNEFRQQLGDQTRQFMPRLEVEQQFKSLEEKINRNETRLNARDDRGKGMGEIWGWIVGAAGLIGLVITFMRGLH